MGNLFSIKQVCVGIRQQLSLINPSKVTALPRVDIVYLHVNCDDILVRAAVSAGALGIVIAAFGHGNLHINIKPALIKIARSGIPVVRSTRSVMVS